MNIPAINFGRTIQPLTFPLRGRTATLAHIKTWRFYDGSVQHDFKVTSLKGDHFKLQVFDHPKEGQKILATDGKLATMAVNPKCGHDLAILQGLLAMVAQN